jgi:hypothetical protein
MNPLILGSGNRVMALGMLYMETMVSILGPGSGGRRLVASTFIFGAAWTGPLVAPAQALADVPEGVFSLGISDKPCTETVLANANVTGISIRCGWRDLEPTEGVYDWTFLDSEIAGAAAAGKQVILRVMSQAGKPDWVTSAIQQAGGQFFTYDDNGVMTTIPVFWDPTFLSKKKAMIAELGSHFANDPTVAIVTASFANAVTEDWNVPHSPADVPNWFAAGYTTEKMLFAAQQIIDATMEAFPGKYVSLSIGGSGYGGDEGNHLDPSATYVAENAVATAKASWPGRLITEVNSLSATTPAPPADITSAWHTLWDNQPDIAGQLAFYCFEDSTYRVNGGVPIDPGVALHNSVDLGVSYGMKYIEIYQADVNNLPEVVSYAASILASSRPPTPTPTPSATPSSPPSLLLNVSTRVHVLDGDRVMIGGFIITGDAPKRVVLRALGPSLAASGISGVLSDPVLELYNSKGVLIVQNDNWVSPLPPDIVASGLTPKSAAESLIATTLSPGNYTAVLQGAGGTTGVALCELYDIDPTNSQIVNLSTRGEVGTGDEAMIGGFIIGGADPTRILIRALGPSLSALGVSGALSDPVLQLRDAEGSLIFTNDDWRKDQQQQILDSGLPPSNDKEAAIIATLSPGDYTVTVRGSGNSTGVSLLEAYNLGNP